MLGTMRVPESVKIFLKKAAFTSTENEKEKIVTTKVILRQNLLGIFSFN